jgi:hypothetical protein
MKFCNILITSLLIAFNLKAQTVVMDSTWAKNKIAETEGLLEKRKYRQAVKPVSQLTYQSKFQHYKTYTLGYVVYKCLSHQKKISQKRKQRYLDSASKYLAQEAVYIDNSFGALVYKAMKFNTHLADYQEEQVKIAELNGKIIERYKHNANHYFINYFIHSLTKLKELNQITEDSLLKAYKETSNILVKKLKNKPSDQFSDCHYITLHKNYEKVRKVVNHNCTNIRAIYEPILQIDSTNTYLINWVLFIVKRLKCTEKEWLKPYLNLNGIIEDENQISKNAPLYLAIAQDLAKRGNPSGARSQALKALKMDTSFTSKVYSFIGNLYMNSAGTCKGEDPKNPVHNKAIFILAYQMYQKAKDEQGMARARQYFPTEEEIFTYSVKKGDKIYIGCWIQTDLIF